jgi:hypothetical protein
MKGATRGIARGMDGGKLSEVNARTEFRRQNVRNIQLLM